MIAICIDNNQCMFINFIFTLFFRVYCFFHRNKIVLIFISVKLRDIIIMKRTVFIFLYQVIISAIWFKLK